MSIAKIYSDQSRRVDWNVRRKTDVTLTITCTHAVGGAAFNISTYTAIAEVFRHNDLTTPILTLNQSSGITNGGASGIYTLALTDTQTDLTPDVYFWKFRTTAPTDYLWFNGIFQVNGYTWDGNTNSSASVSLTIGNNNISLAVTIGGADSLAQLGTTLQTAAADTPQDADTFNFYDAVDAVLKKITWANFKVALSAIYSQLTNTPTVITDGAAITLTTAEHTLTTAQAAISVTDNYTGDYCGLRLTLSGITACTLTFETGTAFGVFGGTASGDNTMPITGVAGDVIEICRKKLGTIYTYVGINRGQ